MKKIFVLLISVLLLAFVGCSKMTIQTNPDPPGLRIGYAADQPVVLATLPDADVVTVQNSTELPPGEADKTFWQLVLDNWGSLLFAFLGFIELIVRLTPTEKDNSILNMIIRFLNILIPNNKTGGGKFVAKIIET